MVVGIEMVAQQPGCRPRYQESELGAQRAREGALDEVGHEPGRSFHRLQCDIARKAVGHDHVGPAARQFVAFDEALEPHVEIVGVAKHGGSRLELVGALELLGPDIEQLHARPIELEHDPRIGGAHHRELDEVARIAFGIGAEIEHYDIIVAERRQQRRERRPVDARKGAQRELGHRHHRPGIAAGHHGMSRALLHRVDGSPHGAGLGAADRLARLVRSGDHVGAVDDLDGLA